MVQHCFLLPNNIAPPFLFYVYLSGILTKKKKDSLGEGVTQVKICVRSIHGLIRFFIKKINFSIYELGKHR